MRGPFERVVIRPTKEKPFVRLQLFALDLGGCFVELGHQGDVAESENWLAEHYVDPGGQEQWLYLRGRGLLGRRPPGNPRGKGRPKIEGLSAMGLVENKTNAASDAQRRFQVARQLLLAPACDADSGKAEPSVRLRLLRRLWKEDGEDRFELLLVLRLPAFGTQRRVALAY